MQPMRHELVSWDDVTKLIDHLVPQIEREYQVMVMVTRGGIIPGGLLAQALGMDIVLTAAVAFPAQMEQEKAGLFAWPRFLHFPADELLRGRRTLVMDDVWGSGRTITAVKHRVSAAGGFPFTRVLHFNPFPQLFGTVRPAFFPAVT